jgi:hypothetical protein
MEYTKEQIEIINCKEPVIIAEAYAGCAKSTTAIGFSEARPDKKILYLVYNASMGKEAKKDFKHLKHVTIKTTHGLAYSKFGYKYSNAGKLINSGSYRAIDVNHDLKLNDYELANSILDVWNKYLLSNHFTIDDFCKDYFSVESKFTKKIQKSLEKLWELKTDLKNDIKVEHNLYLKEFFISGFAEVNKYDILILDECLTGDTYIQTNVGCVKIKKLYNMYMKNKELPLIYSFNEEKEIFEYKKMNFAKKTENRSIMEIKTEGLTKIRCTWNHRILTNNGYKMAKDLSNGDMLLLYGIHNQKTKYLLNSDQEQIMLGSFLGDGHLDKRSKYNTYRISFTQGEKQLNYMKMKADCFKIKGIKNIKSGYTGKMNIYQSNPSKTFAIRKNIWDLMDNIDSRGLAIWYMDDGSISTRETSFDITIHCNNLTYEQAVYMQNLLYTKFNISCDVRISKGKYPYIKLNFEQSKMFLKLIKPYMHKDLFYKNPYCKFSDTEYIWDSNYKEYGADFVSEIKNDIDVVDVYDIGVEDNHNFIAKTTNKVSSSGIIVHNCQDSSKLVQYIFEHAECEQKLALGDSLQSIYGFNGAINVLDNLKGYRLPLTASFRINQTTANICNLLFSKFGNKKIDMKGVNEKQVTFNNNINPKQLKKAVIICRTNAMVFGNALELSQNSYLYFEGGISGYRLDFYNDLWWFSCGKPVKNPFLNKFESYRQLCTYAEDAQDVELLSSINIIKLYNKQIPEGIKRIKESSLNNKQKADYILTTAHKSKGNTYKIPVVIENDFSSLFEFEKIKMQLEKYPEMDKKTRFVLEEQIKEPLNLIYVAITRAFDELYLNEDILNWLKKERVVVRE